MSENKKRFDVLGVEIFLYYDASGMVNIKRVNRYAMRRENVYPISPLRLARAQRMQAALIERTK